MSPTRRLLLTCEHAGNRVPTRWRHLFDGRADLLASHRGHDPGAAWLAGRLAKATGAPLLQARVTRLLVDPNRSPHNPRVFSELTAPLPRPEREALLARHHRRHWERVEGAVREHLDADDAVLHVGVHTFTPVLDGEPRDFDVGLLYDPDRRAEVDAADRWRGLLLEADPGLRVRRNAPYRGVADGLVTALRRRFSDEAYAGLELEVSQARAVPGSPGRSELARALGETLARVVAERA